MSASEAQDRENLARLVALVNERALAEFGIRNTVRKLRAGPSPVAWAKIGESLEVSTQAAQQKYGPLL